MRLIHVCSLSVTMAALPVLAGIDDPAKPWSYFVHPVTCIGMSLQTARTGIQVTPLVDLEKKQATVTVRTWHNGETVDITVHGETKTVQREAVFTIENVHLWDGTNDPYLYTARARLASGDEVSARFGCREFRCDPENLSVRKCDFSVCRFWCGNSASGRDLSEP